MRLGRDAHRHRGQAPSGSAFGVCSPPSTTIGLPVARIRSKPPHRSCGPPRMRATTRSAASIAAAMSVCPGRPGFAQV
nr:hypothetical protein [Nocardioides convexus]